MAKKRHAQRKPASQLVTPEQFLLFVELDEFSDDWDGLGLDPDDDMWELCTQIMHSPTAAPVIQGTGGLRKLRFVPSSWSSGKSGAIRVCYAYFARHWTVLLVMAYGKGAKETLTSVEKHQIKRYLAMTEAWLNKRSR